MVRAWLKQLCEQWFGTNDRAARAPATAQPRLEGLEERMVLTPSINPANLVTVPKTMQVVWTGTTGNLIFGNNTMKPFGVGYFSNLQFNANTTFNLSSDGTLTVGGQLSSDGTHTVGGQTLETTARDFTLGRNGALWVLDNSGELFAQVNALGSSHAFRSEDLGVNIIANDFAVPNGNVFAVDMYNQLFNFHSGQTITTSDAWGHDYANNLVSVPYGTVDFAFDSNGDLWVWNTQNDLLERVKGSTTWTAWVGYTFIGDWENPYGNGVNGSGTVWDYGSRPPGQTVYSIGDGYHGILFVV
jgi:hypothetical protein